MKKKQIEKIPYLTLPETVPDKKIKFAGRTAWETIGQEWHLILEIYRNKKGCLAVPVVRYAATKKDWGIYEPGSGWSRRKINPDAWGGRPCRHDGTGEAGRHGSPEEENRLYAAEDLARIKDFFGDIRVWDDAAWWEYFEKNEERITGQNRAKKYERRAERLKERIRNTPPLKEKELLGWADNALFGGKHYLYYKKRGPRAAVCCSACGGVYSGRWKEGISYESRFERQTEEPREERTGKCALCGESGEYKPQGKAKTAYRIRGHAFLADRYMENGVVLRYLEFGKEWRLETAAGKHGKEEMHGAYEELDGIEIARTYFLPGKKPQTDFQKNNPYTGKDFWDDCNLYGMNSIAVTAAPVHPDSWENLKGTFLQYSGMKEYMGKAGENGGNARGYLERYLHFPQMEMLSKMGLWLLVKEMCECRCGFIADEKADRPESFLGIRKDRVKKLTETGGDAGILHVLQAEKRSGGNWTWQQVQALAETGLKSADIAWALGLMGVQKLLNAVSKYAGCGYGTGCAAAERRIKGTAFRYIDYLRMRLALGYDMHNTVYLRPRDLEAAHGRMVEEQNKEQEERRLADAAAEFPMIRQNYRKLRNRYFYEDDTYLIRPARSAEEIVTEGRILHHCVGGGNYLRNHDTGSSYILMLRFKEKPETPYITVEISRDGRIVQWYGAHDKKPDEKNMRKWLDAYVKRLENTGKQTDRVLLMAAG